VVPADCPKDVKSTARVSKTPPGGPPTRQSMAVAGRPEISAPVLGYSRLCPFIFRTSNAMRRRICSVTPGHRPRCRPAPRRRRRCEKTCRRRRSADRKGEPAHRMLLVEGHHRPGYAATAWILAPPQEPQTGSAASCRTILTFPPRLAFRQRPTVRLTRDKDAVERRDAGRKNSVARLTCVLRGEVRPFTEHVITAPMWRPTTSLRSKHPQPACCGGRQVDAAG
jgi:hypothetical protein